MYIAKKQTLMISGIWILVILAVCHLTAQAQPFYTPGDNSGDDWHLFLYAPFAWQYVDGMQAYLDHVHGNTEGTTGQRYWWEDDYLPSDFFEPSPGPDECTLPVFEGILGSCSDDMGTLLIQSHGEPHTLTVEVYNSSQEGWDARDLAYDLYLAQGYSDLQLIPLEYEVPGDLNYPCIGVTDSYLRVYGDFDGALVYVSACYSSTIIDDLVDDGGARVAMGLYGEQYAYVAGQMIEIFFSNMDGKDTQLRRPVSHAKWGMPDLAVYGAENTTLTVAVQSVDYPSPIKLGDTITITFDTKCDTYANPEIWCDWGYVNPGEWMADSLT